MFRARRSSAGTSSTTRDFLIVIGILGCLDDARCDDLGARAVRQEPAGCRRQRDRGRGVRHQRSRLSDRRVRCQFRLPSPSPARSPPRAFAFSTPTASACCRRSSCSPTRSSAACTRSGAGCIGGGGLRILPELLRPGRRLSGAVLRDAGHRRRDVFSWRLDRAAAARRSGRHQDCRHKPAQVSIRRWRPHRAQSRRVAPT